MAQIEIDQFLTEIYVSNQKLAYEMLENHLISLEEVKKLLGLEHILLGQILIEDRLIFQPELDIALVEQRHQKKKLGEILVETNIINPYQLEKSLIKQYRETEKIASNLLKYEPSWQLGQHLSQEIDKKSGRCQRFPATVLSHSVYSFNC